MNRIDGGNQNAGIKAAGVLGLDDAVRNAVAR